MEVRAKMSWSRSTEKTAGIELRTMELVERKEVERWRRQQMKELCTKLGSLIPKKDYSSKGKMTQSDILDAAAAYVKDLKERVDELEAKRSSADRLLAAMGEGGPSTSAAMLKSRGGWSGEGNKETMAAPMVVVQHLPPDGSSLDIVMIGGVEHPVKLHELITVLEEEGAEVINANVSAAGRKIFCTVHAK
ncbi:hypothetical protein EJB05_23051, partial [Eragrostis curvula]